MLLNSLIFLLLSNSITSRRDKSILYSRITITILLISAFIAYDNLFFLFLAKGIGIFGDFSHLSLSLSLGITFISLVGIPSLVGFFGKQMILSLSISIITLVITLFIFIPEELLSLANILALFIFNL